MIIKYVKYNHNNFLKKKIKKKKFLKKNLKKNSKINNKHILIFGKITAIYK